MKLLVKLLLALVAGTVLAGCATSRVDPGDRSVSVVYGYFDMKAAPSNLTWVSVKRYGGEEGYFQVKAKQGVFFHLGVEQGSYQVDRFGGMGGIPLLTRQPYEYDFGGKGRNATAIRVDQPGAYFMGSHTFEREGGGFFRQAKFSMSEADEPTEKQILEQVIAQIESSRRLQRYEHQRGLLKARLAALK